MVFIKKFDSLDPANYVDRLRRQMSELKPKHTRLNQRKSQIHNDLLTCTHVFVRVKAIKKPLQPPDHGPYRVIDRKSKFFIVEINGKQDSISVDRLKVAHTNSESGTPTPIKIPQPTSPNEPQDKLERFTRSGRRVRWPSRLYPNSNNR